MMPKIFFVIGMRRSGTSILRTLLLTHPKIKDVLFEPHDLWSAVDLNHFSRFKRLEWVQNTMQDFKKRASQGQWYGAKFALNPGTKALEWVWLHKTFLDAKFIFIIRNKEDTWRSFCKQDKDSVRGIIPKQAFDILYDYHINTFKKYACIKCFIYYENLVHNADQELISIWNLLDIKKHIGLNKLMKKPEHWSG